MVKKYVNTTVGLIPTNKFLSQSKGFERDGALRNYI